MYILIQLFSIVTCSLLETQKIVYIYLAEVRHCYVSQRNCKQWPLQLFVIYKNNFNE